MKQAMQKKASTYTLHINKLNIFLRTNKTNPNYNK